jgi:hypothetical protein
MTRMGKHSPPLDGVALQNGHALAPFTIPAALQVRQAGPVAAWPQQDKWQRAMSAARRIAAHRAWLAAVPVVLVNAVAFSGQLAFLRTHLPWTPAGQVLVAVTLESVAVYLAWQAHLALSADDSALRLRLSAYGFAAIIGVMNYSHWMAPHWRPTFTAVTFGLMSVSSPWLWSVHSRRVSRDALKAKGLIEPHAVRLGATRWTWHLLRCVRVMSRATWAGENDPVKAIALPALKAARSDAESDPVAIAVVTPAPAPVATPQVPTGASRSDSAPVPKRRAASATADRRETPSVATDDDLVKLALPLFGGTGDVTKYAVIKAVKEASGKTLGNDRARRILELARHAADKKTP